MPDRKFKMPLYAAFFCAAILAGCSGDQAGPQALNTQCPTATSAIASVQGERPESPKLGQQVTVQGIVTLVQANKGVYIEEPGSDTNIRTSNAIFIQSNEIPKGITTGSLISVRGHVSEIGKGRHPLTALTEVNQLIQCASNQALPLTDVTLPLNGLGREALEGMRIQFNDTLVVTDVYQFGRGKFTLSGNGRQFVPTEVMPPGPKASRLSAQNRSFALPVMKPESLDHSDLLISGTAVNHITGILAHDGRGLRVSLQSISADPTLSFAPPATVSSGSLRIVAMNLHNYFNGDGKGHGFPTPRGAETVDEFHRQRARIGAAIQALDPHIIAVMELENDGFGPASASEDFIQLAENATGQPWAVARPVGDNTGTDQITVGLFYRSDLLKAVGAAQTLTGPVFKRSRQPQAQLFQQFSNDENILVVINHLKSKGSCPDSGKNADQKDGQGCWNPSRRVAAKKMSAWAKTIATKAGTDNILILGDMNAYRKEQPIQTIRDTGFTELMDQTQEETYSFVYYGQHGTLDYAFSSDALLDRTQAFIWHVNAALPPNMALPQPWLGFSDHDPVVVDIRSRHSKTSD